MARKGYKKYRAVKVEVDGVTFDSKREAERYLELKLMVKNGEISGLQLQPAFELQEGFTNSKGQKVRPIIYKADFAYYDTRTNENIVEDVKSPYTAKDTVYRMKMKMFIYKYKDLTFIEYI